MLDFFIISTRMRKNTLEIYPKFIIKKSKDLMIRGGDFYAIWVEDLKMWSTDENVAINLIDSELEKYKEANKHKFGESVFVSYLWDAETGMIDSWHKYCQRQMRDNYHMLDEKIIFSNEETNRESYATKKLKYPLEKGEITAFDKIISTLYSKEERHKIEWAIGSVVTGDSKFIQKFLAFYGSAGTGKSTILNIISDLFDGYYATFNAKALGSNNNSFALEAFKNNPLIAIQHDADLSKIEDNTLLNSLISHEEMIVNEKFKSQYSTKFNAFLFIGTNKPVKITDARSGIIRRLIDVSPTGKKLAPREYDRLTKLVKFELGAIAYHCKEIYEANPAFYNNYIPTQMMGASNDFYNFMEDSYLVFKKDDSTTLNAAWEMYRVYCEKANIQFPFNQRVFKEELRNYFWEYAEKYDLKDGKTVFNYFKGFRTDRFVSMSNYKEDQSKVKTIDFGDYESIFDKECIDCLAQYANRDGTPGKSWDKVSTTLRSLDTTKVHYVRVPENHIVIDFDIPDENGNKDYEKNLAEASKWPPTYAELSKSGAGIHLHYIYTGDVTKLSHIYGDHVEVKVFTGKSSLRRKLSKCNNLPIASIGSGLPLKKEKNVINFDVVKSENGLRNMIKRNLNKEIHPATKPSIDFINKILDDAYNNGIKYDVTDMRNAVLAFAANSTNQSNYCVGLVNKMKFKSENYSPSASNDDQPIVFYDVEVFPNLFLVNYKIQGEGNPVFRLINPKPSDIELLMNYRLVGFNCRRYDNHMLYGCYIGYDNMQLYKLSQKMISGDSIAFFGEAFNISYTDVYDFCTTKQSLKKWEIELGIHHQELGLPWDQPVPEEMWNKVAEYCDNDVIATEAVFNARQADFMARKIQVDLVEKLHGVKDVNVNDTTNTLSTKITFGNNKTPQNEFNYRDLSQPVGPDQYEEYREKFGSDYVFRVFDDQGLPTYQTYIPGEPLPAGYSILPFFKGYKFEFGKSTYLGEEIGEGGRVYAEPGIHYNVWDGDITSQHPHSIKAEVLFGPKYTKIFYDIVQARVAVKSKNFEKAETLLYGVLKPYLNEEMAGGLAQALKIVINSIYGLTSASFTNPFRDKRNVDNIVAKRGALFMTLLTDQVKKKGYQVCHVKTDSIKIPNADEYIKDFVIKFGKEYGYNFETEAEFERFCIVNDAVYVAKDVQGKWHATGTQFKVPYVFKKLFTKEPIEFEDMCETFQVSKGVLYLDMNEELPSVASEEKELEKYKRLLAKEDFRKLSKEELEDKIKELTEIIDKGHNYIFVGKVGQFCPMIPGNTTGVLYRKNEDKYYAVSGSKGYRWLESEIVRTMHKEDYIDRSFYDILCDKAIDVISKYGDFYAFVEGDIQLGSDVLKSDPLPF